LGGKKEKLKFGRSQATSRLREVSRSEIWGFFAGKSQIIAVNRPEAKPKAEQSWKIKFGWRSLQGFGTVKFLLVSPEYLEGLDFSATFPKGKIQSCKFSFI